MADCCQLRQAAIGQKRPFARTSPIRGHVRQLLTTGIASIDCIAVHMGHTNGNMIRQHYGTWIKKDGPDVVGMLQLALKLSPVAVLQ